MPKRKNGNPKNGKARKKKDEYDVIVINPTIDAAFTFFMYAELLFIGVKPHLSLKTARSVATVDRPIDGQTTCQD